MLSRHPQRLAGTHRGVNEPVQYADPLHNRGRIAARRHPPSEVQQALARLHPNHRSTVRNMPATSTGVGQHPKANHGKTDRDAEREHPGQRQGFPAVLAGHHCQDSGGLGRAVPARWAR
jgi:hypothetical protein